MSITWGGGSLSRGDRVQQVAPVGISSNREQGILFVQDTLNDEVIVSREANGQPLTDSSGTPKHYPVRVFRRL